ncbi:MAG: ABC transporter permease [Acetobacteraceae bacterium]|nr:ABC transporter permease [Acetobacteraceae bacterium]MBV8575657.1 ABC transporter permease [Acetobacteraceae bacterium]
MSLRARNSLAVTDVAEGARMWRLSCILGWLDIRLRYRGSLLGPFWLTLSTAVMIGALGVLYSELFKMEIHDYLPFLALSLLLWGFISTLVGDACNCFTQYEGVIRSIRMPYFLYAMRVVVRNLLVLAHNIVVILAVYAVFDAWPGWRAVVAVPGIVIWIIDALAISLLLGAFCARFRDIPPIVGSVMQIAFFVTPIIWKAELVGENARYLPLNPFFSLIEVVRAPLLGGAAANLTWAAAIGYSLILCGLSWALFSRVRGRLAFWV